MTKKATSTEGPSISVGEPDLPERIGRWALLLIALLSILPYLNALGGGFVFDDRALILNHPAVQGPFHLGRILSAPLLGDVPDMPIWRPVTTLSCALDWIIGGGRPFWFHLTNLLLYLGITILWFLLVKRLFRRPLLALVAASLFAVHPIHTEAVAWISGRTDLLAAFFSLLALHLAWTKNRRWSAWTPLAIFLAIGSKESAAVLPVILLYTRWALGSEKRLPSLAVSLSGFISLFVYLLLRRVTQGSWFFQGIAAPDNPLLGTSLAERIPTVLDNVGRYAALLLWPARLSVDYSAPVLERVRGLTAYLGFGLLISAALLFLSIRRRQRAYGWGAGFAILTFALASNLIFPVVTIFAERLLFLSSAGLLLVVASGGVALARSAERRHKHADAGDGRRWAPAGLAALWIALLMAGSIRTGVRNADYRSELALYQAGVRTTPRSYKMHANLALEYSRLGRHEDALREAREAVRLRPDGPEARYLVAGALDSLGRGAEAEQTLRESLRLNPLDRGARRRLLFLLSKPGRIDSRDSVAAEGMRLEPGEVEWIEWAASGAQTRGDYGRAADLWRTVTQRATDSKDAPLKLGFCLLQAGRAAEAREAYREALRRSPDSATAANGLAWCLLDTGGSAEEAERLARQAAQAEPTAPHLDTLARACLAAGKCPEALEAATRAASLDPADPAYEERKAEIEAACR